MHCVQDFFVPKSWFTYNEMNNMEKFVNVFLVNANIQSQIPEISDKKMYKKIVPDVLVISNCLAVFDLNICSKR